MSKLAVVRVKGSADIKGKVKDTLSILNLTRPNHCVLLEDNSANGGMLEKAKEMVTWGNIESKTLEELLKKRGEMEDGSSITDDIVQENSSYDSVSDFAESVCENEASLEDLNGIKKFFRLHPPKKGYNSTNRSFEHGGAMGDRGEKMNDLLLRMI